MKILEDTEEHFVITTDAEEKDRPINGMRVAVSDSARAMVADITGQLLVLESYYEMRKRKRKEADQILFEQQVEAIICDLIHRDLTRPGKAISVPFTKSTLGSKDRYRHPILNKTLPRVIRNMAMPEMDFLQLEVGSPRAFTDRRGKQTTIKATDRLRGIVAHYGVGLKDLAVRMGGETIILKEANNGPLDRGERIQYTDTADTDRYRDEMRRINIFLREADINLLPTSKPVDVNDRFLVRIFNDGSFARGGRLFGGFWQNISRSDRHDFLLIDDSDTVTLDYGQMAPRILYGLKGVQPHFEDAYTIPGLEDYRTGMKKVFNSMIHPEKKLSRKPRGTKSFLPPTMSIQEITEAIMAFHSPIEDLFFAGRGMEVFFIESQILVAVLIKLLDLGIVALPIHDAIVVAAHHQAQAQSIMLDTFSAMTGAQGLVSIENIP
ncbi:hypothetical protein [Cupriavidus pampae]|uniref:Uncharacterized protein n=1 Tax=Cupriavidus pampae TaxID=659251 RepID=A0ABM8WNH3_9BURK|nr:hypothetical protein [Cupriavidus pampae]CAG9168955.1 hypothetical protein LMG32289_01537 [Cupriavidus pampae]